MEKVYRSFHPSFVNFIMKMLCNTKQANGKLYNVPISDGKKIKFNFGLMCSHGIDKKRN